MNAYLKLLARVWRPAPIVASVVFLGGNLSQADASRLPSNSIPDRVAAVRQALQANIQNAPSPSIPLLASWVNWPNWGDWANWNNWNNWNNWVNWFNM
jgi:hypothetical protein